MQPRDEVGRHLRRNLMPDGITAARDVHAVQFKHGVGPFGPLHRQLCIIGAVRDEGRHRREQRAIGDMRPNFWKDAPAKNTEAGDVAMSPSNTLV